MSKIRVIFFDLNPKHWLSPFADRSISHIVLMGLFYHVLGLALMGLGNMAAYTVVADYAPAGMPVSIASSLASGPIEESLFFGIPYLVFSNPYILLVVGSLWSALHLFNVPALDFANVSYGSFLFTVPHIFFSIRVWTCGRGWLAIAFHSAWNLGVLLYVCGMGTVPCSAFGEGVFFVTDVLLVVISAAVSVLTYLSYQQRHGRAFPRMYYIAALVALIGSGVPLAALNMLLFF